MNKIVSTKNTSAIFLATVLVLGTIALSSPSFMVGAQAVPQYGMEREYGSYEKPEYGSYEQPEYPSYKSDYKPVYPSDNSYKSKKDSNSIIKNIKCNNINNIVISDNIGDVNVGNKGAEEGYVDGYSSDGGSGYGDGGYYNDGYDNKRDKGFDCIINNNNTITNIGGGDGGGNQTTPPGPTTANLNVTKTTTCDVQEFGTICNFNPQLTVTGNNPTPSTFTASQTPAVVTLGAGQYSVTEAGFVPGLQDCSALGFDGGQTTSTAGIFICTNFSDDCDGDISAGQNLSCNITNTVIDTNVPPQTATLIVTKLVSCLDETEDSPSCAELLTTITEDQFNISVTSLNPTIPPTPSQFSGSETGTVVTLGTGPYQVIETIDASVATEIAALGGTITGPNVSFSGDCTEIPLTTTASGTITAAGESQTCNITNTFTIEEDDAALTVASSPIMTQGTGEGGDLSALEKIEKLKQQWLELLP